MKGLTAVLDSCVLYPAPLRDFLMHLALADAFRARWTDEIHREWTRSVLEMRPDLTREQLERTKSLMNAHVRDCLVVGYESITETLSLPDPNDRHVLAAALHCQADVIVTYNLSDFPNSILQPLGCRAQHPDWFVTELFGDVADRVCLAAQRQRQSLKNPPKTVEQYLETLQKQGLPNIVALLKQHCAKL